MNYGINKFCFFLLVLFTFFSCTNDTEEACCELTEEEIFTEEEPEVKEFVESRSLDDTLGHLFEEAGLVDVQSLQPEIMVDLKYATEDNFMGFNMYGGLKKAYLQPEVAQRLAKVQDYLDENYPHLKLYVFDAVRPLSVQQMMWDALDSIPVVDRVKFVSNPKNGSIHNYGAAVDLSLFNTEKDTLLDMGAGYDDLRKIAYPKYEDRFLEEGLLTKEQVENRKLLRDVMRKGGFWVLPTEWWHFNAFNRDQAKERFEQIK